MELMEITIQVTQKNGTDFINYIGPINEEAEVHLARLLETVGKQCVINFRQVEYVNSCGVRAWINFMRELEKSRQIVFEECPSEIVMQINMIPSFRGKAKVKSVYGSYACGECGETKSQLFEAGKNLPQKESDQLPPVVCGKCGSEMELEELEDEFFAFSMAG
jgi:anti-anti-sigma regulatory factor